MRAKVFCKEMERGWLTFYVTAQGKEYFLFRQTFKKTVKDYFQNGIGVHAVGSFAAARGEAVKKTLEKLPLYLKYVEKEYQVQIYEKCNEKKAKKRREPYKRQAFRLQDYAWAM